MHAVDLAAVFLAALAIVLTGGVLARQRYMLRVSGAIALAIRIGGDRWLYGVARYVGGELRWYRALGFGTRPSKVLRRSRLQVVGRRAPDARELKSLPSTVVIVECSDGVDTTVLALGESAYTGFVSWLESSAPMS
ncbi:MAG: DUF2550 domain-containing protein [Solirubrobacteraceae bacterium]